MKANQIWDWFYCSLSVQQFVLACARLCLGFVLDKLQDFCVLVWRARRRPGSVLSPEKALEGLSGSVRLHGTCGAAMWSRRDAYWDKMAIAT